MNPIILPPEGMPLPWSWCADCQRAYPTGTYRLRTITPTPLVSRVLKLCPYLDCPGSAVTDRWQWSSIRQRHPEYPEQPLANVRYEA